MTKPKIDAMCDVLIAGGGPTGVTLAVLLARRGVNVIVVEKEADIYPLPRAAHIDHEGMRILQEAGVADAVMATARRADRYDFINAKGDVLLRFEGATRTGAGGWPSANMIHQPSVEAQLRKALASAPNADLRTSSEATGYEEHGDCVVARISGPDGDYRIQCQYLVGADGARSPVRKAAGISFNDLNFEEPWLVVDVLVDDSSRLPTANLQICDPDRPTTCVLMGEGRHRWEFMIKPGETAEEVCQDSFIERLLEPWDVKGAVRLERKAVYTFRARIAENWRKGRVLLAGDAAHQTPPFAGQGMCSGLRDAANLAWKLAAVTKDNADPALLDTYQPEREPNLRATIDMAIMMGKTVCVTCPWRAWLRDAKFKLARRLRLLPTAPPVYPPISQGKILTGSPGAGSYFPQFISSDGQKLDDVLGLEPKIIRRDDMGIAAVAPFAAQIGEWLDAHGAEAMLIRPDRYVFGTGTASALKSAWGAINATTPDERSN
ncbi:bifunctional 3-(3-hydroxy-phenyl)propionate/3-hydroxycinnamic acid hydroxylase [Sphingomonas lacunae]|uniref:Bifunctional 3-(3-hydroxy-phenyl)propionate/3-hydroxycinnamic acid hydroxylase n=1 Tax=Sphingomonas lacunae TaxID=2698828 RepID=A0A6M4AX31_9SPHN|nr:bifunctional 3-(3-hydroxy-phenyl)propionate/3-hydroxycinnamic acid hydroxylase [Sphingomonas lacunae]QJQ32609.1 bifunctional 3-(3-hydroxy-phenyl)propionate/3-hydroxycinnamic acid hydroxylase [Sphingomonas lacunae]